jgi:hypothetical protein
VHLEGWSCWNWCDLWREFKVSYQRISQMLQFILHTLHETRITKLSVSWKTTHPARNHYMARLLTSVSSKLALETVSWKANIKLNSRTNACLHCDMYTVIWFSILKFHLFYSKWTWKPTICTKLSNMHSKNKEFAYWCKLLCYTHSLTSAGQNLGCCISFAQYPAVRRWKESCLRFFFP